MSKSQSSSFATKSEAEICIIEAFYGGSHKQLINLITAQLDQLQLSYDLYTLPAKKWHWRARCSALILSQTIPRQHKDYKVIFTSSVLNLAELVALRPDLAKAKKVVYFHENQLTYPVQIQSTRNKNVIENKDQRDFQYGYNQILTSLVADQIFFNSIYNKTTFLSNINSYLKKMPDKFKLNVERDLVPKCDVLYFPIDLSQDLIDSFQVKSVADDMLAHLTTSSYLDRPISILWSHRWEHDKNPEQFFDTLFQLDHMGIDFRLHVIGEQFTDVPEIFNIAKEKLKGKISTWGFLPSRDDYYRVLAQSDLILSTSLHEFFGVAVVEACLFGAYPILPNRLAYPEIYPRECLYSTDAQLLKKLKQICSRPRAFRLARVKKGFKEFDSISTVVSDKTYFNKYKWSCGLRDKYMSIFN